MQEHAFTERQDDSNVNPYARQNTQFTLEKNLFNEELIHKYKR